MTGVGIVGLGGIAAAHATAIGAVAAAGHDLRVVAYAGRSESAERLGLGDARPASFEELIGLPEVDLVVDCSPSELHGRHALAALDAGKSVVVEKPLATDLEEARAVVDAAEARGAFGTVAMQRRFERQHAELKRLLDSGALGDVVVAGVSLPWWRDEDYFAAAEWRRLAPGGGVLLNQAIHSVDLLIWLLGPVADAAGYVERRWRPGAGEDAAAGVLRFASGALATILATTGSPPGSPATLTLHTTRGTASFDQTEVATWTFDGVPAPRPDAVGSGGGDARAIGHAGHVALWRDVAESLQDGRSPAVTLRDHLGVLEVMFGLLGSGPPEA